MTWKTPNIMTLRKEFIHLALQEGANRRELCRRFEISPKTAYKWLQRAALSPASKNPCLHYARRIRPGVAGSSSGD
jgi:transposase-like protein